jgi:ribose transport system permease protein
MPPEAADPEDRIDHARISDVTGISERSWIQGVVKSQPFWVTVALIALSIAIGLYQPSFVSVTNLANVTRNFAPFGIMALGMTVVIITGGIDLSVGSIMGLVAIVAGLFLTWEYPWYVAFAMGLLAGLACGAVNGFFVAYVGMSPFVVTLGMMSIARSLAVVFSGNQMLYKFGPDAPIVKAIGQAKFPSGQPDSNFPHWIPAFSSHFWAMILLAVIVSYVLNKKPWGRHLYAIGGNEQGARMTGVNVDLIKFQAYVFSAFCASVASLLILGYSGSAINALGQTYELRVIAATVIGGANLMGGAGTAYGAVIGSALLEVIRNALLMAGIDANWQGAFVGAFIILAVLIGMETRGFSLTDLLRNLFRYGDR